VLAAPLVLAGLAALAAVEVAAAVAAVQLHKQVL
jgi:hypothetical protein